MIKLYLKKGWNFVSFPSNDINTVISNLNVVEIKDLKSTWNRSVPSFFNTLKQFEYNKGYIVKSIEDTFIEFNEHNIKEINYSLNNGWNLIGWQKDIQFTDLILPTNLIEIKSISNSYNKNIPQFFNTLNILEQGISYWVKMDKKEDWKILLEESKFKIISSFDNNFREFNVEITFNQEINKESKLTIENISNIDNNIVFLPGNNNRKLKIKDNMIIMPQMDKGNSFEFILQAYNLQPGNYKLELDDIKLDLILPEISSSDYKDSYYFSNDNKPKLLMIAFAGADNNLEKYYFVDMIEHANMVNKNKDNYDICFITLVDRSDYTDNMNDLNNWFENDTFNVTIKDKSLGIYICNSKTNYKWDEFKIGNYQQIIESIETVYDNISTDENILDLFLSLVFNNLKENEKNNPNVAVSIDIWNHGMYYGINVDPKTLEKMIYMDVIYETIQSNLKQFNINKLDYLIFDCCLTASLSNILLFSSITNYLISSSTVQPGNGYNFNFILNPNMNIKNEFLNQLYDETIKSYKRYWETLSVFDMKRFQYFEDILKIFLNTGYNLVDIRGEFDKLDYIERDFKDIKPLFSFLEKYKDEFDNFNLIESSYIKMLLRTSNNDQAIAISQKRIKYDNQYLDTIDNIRYLYDFFERQPGKPRIDVKISSMANLDNIVIITLGIIGKLKNDILLRFSNGFSYVNTFEISSTTDPADKFTNNGRTYLRIFKTDRTTIALTVKSNSKIEIVYFEGKRFYLSKSPYESLNKIRNNTDTKNINSISKEISNLSYSLELSKLHLQNIIGNEDDIISNIEFNENEESLNITGESQLDGNLIIDYGWTLEPRIFETLYKSNNNKLLSDNFSFDFRVKRLIINNIECYLLDYFEDDTYVKVTTIVVYQEVLKRPEYGPLMDSSILNMELIKNKKDNSLVKKFWDAYTYKNIINEIKTSETALIYPINIKKTDEFNKINNITINGMLYKFTLFYDAFNNTYQKFNVESIKDFYFSYKDSINYISVYFRINNKLILKNYNFLPDYTTILKQDDFIEKIKMDFGIQNVLYNIFFYFEGWDFLEAQLKDDLIKLGFTQELWEEKKTNIDLELDSFKIPWPFLSNDIKNIAIRLGYNSYSWDWKKFKTKKSFFVNSDIILVDKYINVLDSLIVIASNSTFIIGLGSTLLLNRSILLNYGTVIIQDDGRLLNYYYIQNMNNGRIVVTTINDNYSSIFQNNNVTINQGDIIVSGNSILLNKYVLRNNKNIILTSSNKEGQLKSNALLRNDGYILPYSSSTISETTITIEFGSSLVNQGLCQVANIFVNNYLENNLDYISKIFDYSNKSISRYVIKKNVKGEDYQTNLFTNDTKKQIYFNDTPIDNNETIYLSSSIKVLELPYYYDKSIPNITADIRETEDNIKITFKNDTDYSSFGYNNKDYIRISYMDKSTLFSTFISLALTIEPKLENYIKVVGNKYKLEYNEGYITINPSIKANDSFVVEIDKIEFVKLFGLDNKTFKIKVFIDINNYVKETNEQDNIIEETFRISL